MDELAQEVRKLRHFIEAVFVGGIFVALLIWAPRVLLWIVIVLAALWGVIGFFAAMSGLGRALNRLDQKTEFRATVRGREVRGWHLAMKRLSIRPAG